MCTSKRGLLQQKQDKMHHPTRNMSCRYCRRNVKKKRRMKTCLHALKISCEKLFINFITIAIPYASANNKNTVQRSLSFTLYQIQTFGMKIHIFFAILQSNFLNHFFLILTHTDTHVYWMNMKWILGYLKW